MHSRFADHGLDRPPARVVQLDGKGSFEGGGRALRTYLRNSSVSRAVLVRVDLGAIRALSEAGREASFGLGVVAVGLTPKRYGAEILQQALAILEKKHVTPATFVVHQVLTTATVDRLYPNDVLIFDSPRTGNER